jgi:type VI protein secretion system component VasK
VPSVDVVLADDDLLGIGCHVKPAATLLTGHWIPWRGRKKSWRSRSQDIMEKQVAGHDEDSGRRAKSGEAQGC